MAGSTETECFHLSPLIRFTLLSLYTALVLPLPFVAPAEFRWLMSAGLLLGLFLIVGLLSEQVETDAIGLAMGYPVWIRWLLRRGWTMKWEDVRALVPVGTSQGGTVYYLRATGLKHQLLPQRIERFDHFLTLLDQKTVVDTQGIGRLTPPWTYQLLAGLALLMILCELAAVVAVSMHWITVPAVHPG